MENKTIIRLSREGNFNMEEFSKRIFKEVDKNIELTKEYNYSVDLIIRVQKIGRRVIVYVGLDSNICNYDLYIDIGYFKITDFDEDELIAMISKIYKQIATLGCLSINLANRLKEYYRGSTIEYEYSYLEITGEVKEIREC